VSSACLQGISLSPPLATPAEFVRSLREIAGVPSRGWPEVMKFLRAVLWSEWAHAPAFPPNGQPRLGGVAAEPGYAEVP
jgi:hypothetical protein